MNYYPWLIVNASPPWGNTLTRSNYPPHTTDREVIRQRCLESIDRFEESFVGVKWSSGTTTEQQAKEARELFEKEWPTHWKYTEYLSPWM